MKKLFENVVDKHAYQQKQGSGPTIAMNKQNPEERLGLDREDRGSMLQVKMTQPGGLIDLHNATKAEKLKVGDFLMKVNGVAG